MTLTVDKAIAPPQATRRLDPLARTSLGLIVTNGITASLGVVFWALASRLYPAAQLGEDAALISAMMLLSIVAQLNLHVGIQRLLPQVHERRWRPVAAAYGGTAGLACVATVVFVVVAPRVSDGFSFLTPSVAVALVLAVIFWNIFALQDAVLVATRWVAVLPVENGLFGVIKIGLMVLFVHRAHAHGGPNGIFLAWVVAMGIMVVPVNALLFGRVLRPGGRGGVGPSETVLPLHDRGRIARYLATDYVASLLSHGYQATLPLLVIGVLGRTTNAYFYVAFLIVVAISGLAQAFSTSLIVEGAHDESALPSLTARSVRRYVALVCPVVLVLAAASPILLWPFGPSYVTNGTTLLRLLLIGTIPLGFVTIYLGVQRVRARVTSVLAFEATTVALVVGGSLLAMRTHGLVGIGWAWLIAHTVVAAWVTPRLLAVRTGSDR